MYVPGAVYVWLGFWLSAVPPSPKSHRYVSGSLSGSRPAAVNDTVNGARPLRGSPPASTLGAPLPGSGTPHSSDPAAPAATSMPPRMCRR